jgi:hypothetical protein
VKLEDGLSESVGRGVVLVLVLMVRRCDHFPVGVSSANSNIPIAVAVMSMNGTRNETRHATWGASPRSCTNESKIAGMAKLSHLKQEAQAHWN